MKQVFENNLFLIKLCFSASPLYIITMTLDAARNQISIFFEHTYGIGYVLEAAEFHYPFREVAAFLLILAGCITLGMLFSVIVTDYWAARELPKVRRRVKMALYEKAKELDLKCYDDPDYYNELVLAISEADKQIDRCVTFLQNTASGIAVFVSTGIYFFSKDKLSIGFAAASFGLSFVFNQLYNRLSYEVRMKRNPFERKRDYVKRVFYLSDYAKELRLNPQASDILFTDFDKANDEIYKVEKSYANRRFALSFLFRYVSNYFFGDVLYTSYLVFKAAVAHTLSSLYVQKIRDFLDYETEIKSWKGLPSANRAKTLELKHVSFAYNKADGNIIKDVSLSVMPGEKIALVGYNGAGKTTLIKLIMRLYEAAEGEILAGGIDIRDYDVEKYRHSIGTVFQDFKIFAGTVTENVLLDLDNGTEKEKVRDALCRSGLAERTEGLPYGLDTQLTTEFAKEGVNLSGGKSQKLAIGRVFYKDAGLIILDEPSSALDPIAEY